MRLRWTRPALADLEAIADYVAAHDTQAAVALTRRIHGACMRLIDFPASGRPGRVAETRELVIAGTPYIAAYSVRNDDVIILAVIHGSRRWPDDF